MPTQAQLNRAIAALADKLGLHRRSVVLTHTPGGRYSLLMIVQGPIDRCLVCDLVSHIAGTFNLSTQASVWIPPNG